jgi:hypothetical protein
MLQPRGSIVAIADSQAPSTTHTREPRMTIRSICTRTAIIALAVVALAAPAASARPSDLSPVHTDTSVPAPEAQDLRSADAIDAATRAAPGAQDLRSADAIDAATRAAPEAQDLRSADAIDAATQAALDSQANTAADTTPQASAERGIAWTTIAIGIVSSLLALGIIAGISSRMRRTARARISA